MRKNTKRVLVVTSLIAVAALLAWAFGVQQSIILVSDNPNVVYQYAGELPVYKQDYIPGRSGVCLVDKAFVDAGITPSAAQVITVGDNRYEFTVTNVRKAESPASECGAIIYDVAVSKNGAVLDQISFSNPAACDELPSTTVTKDYGDVKATFAFRSEYAGDSNYCPPRHAYIINKYEIASGLSCPAGTSFNSQTQLCEAVIRCPEGSSFEASSQKCVYTAPAEGCRRAGKTGQEGAGENRPC